MFKLIFCAILLFHTIKCDVYPLDECLDKPEIQIRDLNSKQRTLSNMNKDVYVTKFNTDFDAEGINETQDVVFEVTEDINGLKKKENLKEQYTYLKNIYEYLHLTFNKTDEETKKCIAKMHNVPEDSFYVMLTNLQNDVEVKLKYLQPILSQVCTTYKYVRNTNFVDDIKYTVPYELNTYIRKIVMYNLINDIGYPLSIDKKLKLFETNDCILQEHVLPNIIKFFDIVDKNKWMKITSILKVYSDQCLALPEDVEKLKNYIPSSSIKNLIFEDTVRLRNIETNSYLKSINVYNMTSNMDKKISYYSNNDTFTIQNVNGKYMQVITNRHKNIVGSHQVLNNYAFWKVAPTDDKDYVYLMNIGTPRYLYINENQNAEINTNSYSYRAITVMSQWEVEANYEEPEIEVN